MRDGFKERLARDKQQREASARAERAAVETALAAGAAVIVSLDAIPEEWASFEITLGGHHAGTITVKRRGDTVEIGKLYIQAEYRSRGIGGAAVRIVAALAARDKVRWLVGEIERGPPEDIERRQQFWTRCGFSVEGDRFTRALDGAE